MNRVILKIHSFTTANIRYEKAEKNMVCGDALI
jgi:hypothetical protein